MKSSIRKRTYKAMYRLLDHVSPVNIDCGTLCDAICCTYGSGHDSKDFQLGIYLLPGEEKVFSKKDDWLIWSSERAEDYDYPDSWYGKVYFVRCKTPPICPRHLRPLQCRTFPLAPHISKNGELKLILSKSDLPYKCPLITEGMELTPEFIKATYTVWKRLIKDHLIYDLVNMDSRSREHYLDDNVEMSFL